MRHLPVVNRRRFLEQLGLNRIVVGSAATAPYSSPDWIEEAVAAAWQGLKTIHDRAMRAS